MQPGGFPAQYGARPYEQPPAQPMFQHQLPAATPAPPPPSAIYHAPPPAAAAAAAAAAHPYAHQPRHATPLRPGAVGPLPPTPLHAAVSPPQQRAHLYAQQPAPAAGAVVVAGVAPSTPRAAGPPGALVPHAAPASPPASANLAKVVTVVHADTGEAQAFRLCPGEVGDNVRAAIRGAFGVPDGTAFTIRDAGGVNVVLGYPSVQEGGRYELVARRTPQEVAAAAAGGGGATAAFSQTAQPPTALSTLQHVRRVAPADAAGAATPPLPPLPLKQATQEVAQTRPQSTDDAVTATGSKNRVHSQANPMPSCTKALLIGACYAGQKEALPNSVRDAQAVRTYLGDAGFHGQHLVLTDDNQQDAAHLPTRENLLRAFEWLVQNAKAGDSLFLHFSGHGVEVRTDGESEYEEALLPVDFRATKPFQVVKQEEINEVLLSKLPAGCKLTILCDCAHGGSLLKLPFSVRGKKDGAIEWLETVGHTTPEGQGQVVVLSGWRGDQTTDSSTNALSQAFLHAMGRDTNPTVEQLLVVLRDHLQSHSGPGFQVPVIASNCRLQAADVCCVGCIALLF